MSDEDITKLQIENLVYRLNAMAEERKVLFDKLWQLEAASQDLRKELIKKLDGRPPGDILSDPAA